MEGLLNAVADILRDLATALVVVFGLLVLLVAGIGYLGREK
jgi:hypothetical protein